jgi:hypothetical protein
MILHFYKAVVIITSCFMGKLKPEGGNKKQTDRIVFLGSLLSRGLPAQALF